MCVRMIERLVLTKAQHSSRTHVGSLYCYSNLFIGHCTLWPLLDFCAIGVVLIVLLQLQSCGPRNQISLCFTQVIHLSVKIL